MSTPPFRLQSTEELIADREQILRDIYPFTIEMLDKIRYTDAIEPEQLEALELYETLTWLIKE